MTAQPNGSRAPYEVSQTEYAVECFVKVVGGGVGVDLTLSDASNRGGGEIESATWTSTGTYTIVFRRAWPALLFAPIGSFVNATADFNMNASAIDVAARTATFVFNSNTTPTDVATTVTAYIRWTVLAVNKR